MSGGAGAGTVGWRGPGMVHAVTVHRRDGSLTIRPTDDRAVNGPVADWAYPMLVVVVGELSTDEAVRLGAFVPDEPAHVDVDGEEKPTPRAVLLPATDAAIDTVRSLDGVRSAMVIGQAGWKALDGEVAYGVESSWDSLTVAARGAVAAMGRMPTNLYVQDDDLRDIQDPGARSALQQFKMAWANRVGAPSLSRELGRIAREARWNSPEEVAARQARRDALEAEEHERRAAEQAQLEKASQRAKKAAATRARNKRALAELRREGWPESWSVKQATSWRELGGTVASAQQWHDEGWDAAEVVAAATALGTATLPEPGVQADDAHQVGDTLPDYATAGWPPPRQRRAMSIKCIMPSGARRRVFVTTTSDGVDAEEWRQSGRATGDWEPGRRWSVRTVTDLATVDDSPLLLDAACVTRIDNASDELLQALTVVHGDGNAWDMEWDDPAAEGWLGELEEYRSAITAFGAPAVPVLVEDGALASVEIGGQRVNVILPGEDQLQSGEELVACSWASVGSGPIVWDGTDRLDLVASNLLYSWGWGDHDPEKTLATFDGTTAGLARYVADWLIKRDADAEAACSLERFDPDGKLSPEEASEWKARILGDVDNYSHTDIGGTRKFRASLRDILMAESAGYGAVAAVWADPASERGRQLGSELDESQLIKWIFR